MRLKFAVAIAILASIFSFHSQAQELDLLDPSHGWRSPNLTTRTIFKDSKLTIGSARSSTGIYNQKPLDLLIQDFDLVEIKMKASKGGLGELSWRTAKKPFLPSRSFSFYLGSPDRYHTYYLNLKPYLKENKIDHLLFFPFSRAGEAELTSFKFIKGNLWQKAAGGWQEFWGPTGRSFTGTSFFILKSPQLFGRSIFFYLNWLIGLSLILSLMYKRPRWTILLILAFWVVLEASSAVNNWIFFKDDLSFWGKSLEAKRAMQNDKDFYEFIKFAESRIPAGSNFDVLADPKYHYSKERSAYYLYPRIRDEKADHLLVFDQTPDTRTMRDHRIIARFRTGAYLLKRHDGH
ncbi:hypothetical protein ACFL37_01440 [Candidatus Margulisiibacteriota bacterium]